MKAGVEHITKPVDLTKETPESLGIGGDRHWPNNTRVTITKHIPDLPYRRSGYGDSMGSRTVTVSCGLYDSLYWQQYIREETARGYREPRWITTGSVDFIDRD